MTHSFPTRRSSDLFRMAAEKCGLRLQLRKTDAWVRCDRVMLARILNNLVCNAIRYTNSGGVLVGARRQSGGLRIDVWDTGPGIADRSEEHTSELQSLMRISYAVFCLKKKNN